MWNYEKRLQYPVNITQTNPQIAQVIISQFGGPDGELSASMRYLSQRYTIPYREVAGLLTDIGREAPEMFHLRDPRFFSPSVRGSFQWKLSRERMSCSFKTPPKHNSLLHLAFLLPFHTLGSLTAFLLCNRGHNGKAKLCIAV